MNLCPNCSRIRAAVKYATHYEIGNTFIQIAQRADR